MTTLPTPAARRLARAPRLTGAPRLTRVAPLLLAAAAALPAVGCQSMSLGSFGSYCIDAIPARRLPPTVLARPKADLLETSKGRLRLTPTEVYTLDAGDTLGVYIQNILGSEEAIPPVNFPEDATIPPSIGYPVPIREDGTISLPLVDSIYVADGTVIEAERKIRQAYLDAKILVGDDLSDTGIIVTLMRQREVRVLVIREDTGGAVRTSSGELNSRKGSGSLVDLKVGENDLMTALSATGGLPGVDALNEVIIFKGGQAGSAEFDAKVAQYMLQRDPCACRPPLPDPYGPGAVRIPLRYYPEAPPTFTEEDITLEAGDIVYIPARDREKYYTGGILGGGEFLLPRDYDLNILQAIAAAGGQVGTTGSGVGSINPFGGGRRGGGAGGTFPPSRAIVIRQLPNDCGEIVIRVDLAQALTDPRERILIQPEDTIIVQFTICEEIANTAIQILPFLFFRRGF